MASWVGRKFASWQVLPASSARALRDRGALSLLRSQHNSIELLYYEPLAGGRRICFAAIALELLDRRCQGLGY